MASPVGAALLGTGLFAKDIYKSNFKAKAGEVQLKAVWSRTLESAQAYTAEHFPESQALAGEEGLQRILDDPTIHFVVVCLPVQVALGIAERFLAAGKAVVSEKPVAATVEAARAAIARYRAGPPAGGRGPVWMLAENYRYEAVFHAAVQRLPELGHIIKLDMVCDLPMDARNKYHASAWRRDTSLCPGGFFMDSSVHFVSALRLMTHACGAGETTSVSAHALQAKPDLSYPDTVVGVALTEGGKPASISISLAAHQVKWSLSVVGTAGTLEVSRGGWGGSRTEYTLSVKTVAPPPQPMPGQSEADPTLSITKFGFSGCQDEFAEFLGLAREVVVEGRAPPPSPSARSAPEEGARDLALIEALLESAAKKGQAVAVAQI